MMLLDFSNFNESKLPKPEFPWQESILSFFKDWQSTDDFILTQTSGSTGIPKEIKLPKKAMRQSAKMTIDFFNLQKNQNSLLVLPVNFIAGKMMIIRAMEAGLKLYCLEPTSVVNLGNLPPLDFVPMTPMQVEKSVLSLPQIKTLLIGGAAVSENLKQKLLLLPTLSFESYGMTETITHIALKKISDDYFTLLEGISMRQDDRKCLVIKTPYFQDEIITNDCVELLNPNKFKFLGRIDNVINSGGIKLFPEQIEKKLKSHIHQEFILSSMPDEVLGEKLILIVEGSDFLYNLDEFNLKKFEKPKEVYFVPHFPRTESGKILRKELIEKLKT